MTSQIVFWHVWFYFFSYCYIINIVFCFVFISTLLFAYRKIIFVFCYTFVPFIFLFIFVPLFQPFFLRVKMFSTSLHGIIFCYRILLDQQFFFYFSYIFNKNQIHGLRRFLILSIFEKQTFFFFHRIPDASFANNLIERITQNKILSRVFLSVDGRLIYLLAFNARRIILQRISHCITSCFKIFGHGLVCSVFHETRGEHDSRTQNNTQINFSIILTTDCYYR